MAAAEGSDRLLLEQDLNEFLALLTLAYRVDFTDRNSMDYGTAKGIFDKMIKKRWTYKECSSITNNFIETHVWKNFSVADFFTKAERPSLFGEAWKNAEKEKNINAIANMECYEVPDGTGEFVKMYRYKDPTHPVKGLTDLWSKPNIMKAYAYSPDSEPVEFKPQIGTTNPDAPLDCEKFLSGFAKNLFKSGDYDKLSEQGRKFVDEYLHLKQHEARLTEK